MAHTAFLIRIQGSGKEHGSSEACVMPNDQPPIAAVNVHAQLCGPMAAEMEVMLSYSPKMAREGLENLFSTGLLY